MLWSTNLLHYSQWFPASPSPRRSTLSNWNVVPEQLKEIACLQEGSRRLHARGISRKGVACLSRIQRVGRDYARRGKRRIRKKLYAKDSSPLVIFFLAKILHRLCVQFNRFLALQYFQDSSNTVHSRITFWTKHSVNALARFIKFLSQHRNCLLYTSPSPRD